MGLLLAGIGAVAGALQESWRDYFYCESIPNEVLLKRATRRRGGSNHGSDNIISNGSIIAVADGQCMIIVEQGKVLDFCAQAGEYVFDSQTEPSLFYGDFGTSLEQTFANIGKRFEFGGMAAQDQRVYFVNTKEIMGNKYGTPNPVPFRVKDDNARIDLDVSLTCFGEYSYRIVDPILFYTRVVGNITGDFTRDKIDSQLKTELLSALQPAFAAVGRDGIRYSQIPAHAQALCDALNTELSEKWTALRGIKIESIGIASLKASEEDEARIKKMQENAAYTDPTYGAAYYVKASADALEKAAENSAGAPLGFYNINAVQQASGVDIQSLYQAGAQNAPAAPAEPPKPVLEPTAATWTCACGKVNDGNFCSNCGKPKPVKKHIKCSLCGFEPVYNEGEEPKFCSKCGKQFDENDYVE